MCAWCEGRVRAVITDWNKEGMRFLKPAASFPQLHVTSCLRVRPLLTGRRSMWWESAGMWVRFYSLTARRPYQRSVCVCVVLVSKCTVSHKHGWLKDNNNNKKTRWCLVIGTELKLQISPVWRHSYKDHMTNLRYFFPSKKKHTHPLIKINLHV